MPRNKKPLPIKLFEKDIPLSKMNTELLIIEVFKRNPTVKFKNYAEIEDAIKQLSEDGKITRKEPAISKCMQFMIDDDYICEIGNSKYKIRRTIEGYELISPEKAEEYFIRKLAELVSFESEQAICFSSGVIAYSIFSGYVNDLSYYLRRIIGKNRLFDIIEHGKCKIYVLFDPNTKYAEETKKTLLEIPKRVIEEQKRIEHLKKHNEEQKKAKKVIADYYSRKK